MTKLAVLNGIKVSKPLKIVMISVAPNANQLPQGWNGALYGKSSLDFPWSAKAFMKELLNGTRCSTLIGGQKENRHTHVGVTNRHPCYCTECRHKVDKPSEDLSHD